MPISRKRKELEELPWWQNRRNFGAVSKFYEMFFEIIQKTTQKGKNTFFGEMKNGNNFLGPNWPI